MTFVVMLSDVTVEEAAQALQASSSILLNRCKEGKMHVLPLFVPVPQRGSPYLGELGMPMPMGRKHVGTIYAHDRVE